MKRRIIIFSIITIFCTLLTLTLGCLTLYIFRLDAEINLDSLKEHKSTITRIFYYDKDENGNIVTRELSDEELYLHKSEWVEFSDIPDQLINAFIAIEDKRFYNHSGVDWARTLKAMINHLFKIEDRVFGGSTITQQLVKNITGKNENTIKRKLDEIVKALYLEKRISKEEILEYYLNVVYLSENCYGISSASKVYFNKELKDLTLIECASLASIVNGPSIYNPSTHKENNLKRSKLVLKSMLNESYISEEQYQSAISEELTINPNIDNYSSTGVYSWFTELLLDDVSNDLSQKYRINKEEARQMILKGGYNIYSTINPTIQAILESVYRKFPLYVASQDGKYPESACVIIDPKTSNILAIAGGTGKKSANLIFNRATQAKRPPGSVLKPLAVYGPAIDMKLVNYATVFDDTPIKLRSGYWPKNSPNRYRGLVPVYYAVEHSINTISVKTLKQLGIENSLRYLKSFGINFDEDLDKNESSLALGQLTYGESLLNMTNAYSVFANEGSVSNPRSYFFVTDVDGNVVLDNNQEKRSVISRESAYIMDKILSGVVQNGTAKSLKAKNSLNIRGKTGTSSNNEDKWFVGYTNNYVCGVRVGFDNPQALNYGSNPSLNIFDEIITRIYDQIPIIETEEENPNIIEKEFCFDSGMLLCDNCNLDLRGKRGVVGYFTADNMPIYQCNLHKKVYLDEDGRIVDRFLPFWKIKKASLLDYSREKLDNINVLDEKYLLENNK